MSQLSFQFFWPLTEQIPLDLDYSECNKASISTTINATSINSFVLTSPSSLNTTITASNLVLDIETTTVVVKKEPTICQRVLYRCLGLSWEKR